MVQVLWSTFPRLMEQNLNGLLDGAQPTALKAFQLYKTCRNEGLWNEGLEKFARHLEDFFSRPVVERRKSHFDVHLRHPMDHHLYSDFELNFRSAVVSEQSITDLASWAHNLIRVAKKTSAAFASIDVMTRTIRRITQPPPLAKAENIEFDDFCEAWRETISKHYGSGEDKEFGEIVTELKWLNAELKRSEQGARSTPPPASLYLTPGESEWTTEVYRAAFEWSEVPDYPLPYEPEKKLVKELMRVILLYRIARVSKLPEILENREKIRATLLDRCEVLLDRKKLAS